MTAALKRRLLVPALLAAIASVLSLVGVASGVAVSPASLRSATVSPASLTNAASPELPRGSGATPPYRVEANKVIGSNRVQFVPYGFVIDCMALKQALDTLCRGGSSQDPWTGSAMVTAAAKFWHADVIRFQVAQEYLFYPSGLIDTHYLRLIDRLVDQATRLHMASIITLQEERFNAPPLPTNTAIRFWAYLADHFKNDPHVLFDLYNEPRLLASAAGSETRLWEIWRNGGTVAGIHYVGDQALVDTIRQTGATNVIVAEGNDYDRDLTLLPQYYLNGMNIAYGVEPNLTPKKDTETQWKADFGDVAADVPILPEAFLPHYQECSAAAPVVLPQLLDYLQSIHMGLIVWTLLPGITTVGHNLYDPTTFSPQRRATDPCFNGGKRANKYTTYGEGGDILNYYTTENPR